LFDVIDHYLCTYLLLLCGLFQCFGCGWGFDVDNTMNKSPGHSRAIIYLTVTFWIYVLAVGVAMIYLDEILYGIYALVGGIIIICLLPSLCLSRLSFR
jgi:SNF family Na+-dependent transporter